MTTDSSNIAEVEDTEKVQKARGRIVKVVHGERCFFTPKKNAAYLGELSRLADLRLYDVLAQEDVECLPLKQLVEAIGHQTFTQTIKHQVIGDITPKPIVSKQPQPPKAKIELFDKPLSWLQPKVEKEKKIPAMKNEIQGLIFSMLEDGSVVSTQQVYEEVYTKSDSGLSESTIRRHYQVVIHTLEDSGYKIDKVGRGSYRIAKIPS